MTTTSPAVALLFLGVAALLGCATPTAPAPVEKATDPWNAPLREALAGCDSVQIHGDTPHVVTVEGADRVKQVIDRIRLDPLRSGQAYCCTPNLAFTFARQGTHRASLGSLGGMGWRWAGGPWEGDAVPTWASALALARWLNEQGISIDVEALQSSLEEQRRIIDSEQLWSQ